MKFLQSAGIIIYRIKKNLEYLVLHYELGHWDFSRGGLEKNENKLEAAIRELKEETNLESKVIDDFEKNYQFFYKDKNDELIRKEVTYFLGLVDPKVEVKLSYEHTDYKWLPKDEALEILTFENSRKILEEADNFLKEK